MLALANFIWYQPRSLHITSVLASGRQHCSFTCRQQVDGSASEKTTEERRALPTY